MKKLNSKIRAAVIAFCKFMKNQGMELEETLEMVEEVWEEE